jgi:hypothetical protein
MRVKDKKPRYYVQEKANQQFAIYDSDRDKHIALLHIKRQDKYVILVFFSTQFHLQIIRLIV